MYHYLITLHNPQSITLIIVVYFFPYPNGHSLVAYIAVVAGPNTNFIFMAITVSVKKFTISHNNTPFFWALRALAERPYRARSA